MLGAIPPLPENVFMTGCLVKHRDNFTFIFLSLLLTIHEKIESKEGSSQNDSLPATDDKMNNRQRNNKASKIFFTDIFIFCVILYYNKYRCKRLLTIIVLRMCCLEDGEICINSVANHAKYFDSLAERATIILINEQF
jgi:hypothetical protein